MKKQSYLLASVVLGLSSGVWAKTPEAKWLGPAKPFDKVSQKPSDFQRVSYGVPLPASLKPSVAAGIPVSPPRFEYEARRQDLTRKRGQNSFQTTIEVPVMKVWDEWDWVSVVTYEPNCRTVLGEGKGNWQGFFNAPRNEKASRLASAIKGIGQGTAGCIVDSGVFHSKPRSWGEFKGAIKQAENACPAARGLYYKVIHEFGQENAMSLGYWAQEDCFGWTERTELAWRQVTRREPSLPIRRTIRVSLQNGELLPSESEIISVHFDGVEPRVGVVTNYNRYRVERRAALGDDSDFVVVGEGRVRVTPSNSVTLETSSLNPDAVITLNDRDYVGGIDNPQAQTFVHLTVFKNRRFWADKNIAQTTVSLNEGKAQISLSQLAGGSLSRGDKFYIQYRVERRNSRFNNNSKSDKTESVRFTR